MTTLDPLGHIKISVSDFAASRRFYDHHPVFFADPDGMKLEYGYY